MPIKKFSYVERDQNLKEISSLGKGGAKAPFDLAIIGGGINGAGVARDAASRGMSVVLVESNDFAFGTSSRSSKLIHGGLRYLEEFEFHLVFEALNEKRMLFEIAPHLVHPLRFLIPIYKDSRVGMFKMGLGMWCYDMLSLFEVSQMHERLSAVASLKRQPILNSKDLLGSYIYSDAYMDDDRLVIETLRSANNWGACCLNYMAAIESIEKGERIVGLKCRDELTGNRYDIYAKHIISTVGPWTDRLASQWIDSWQPKLRPSKGIHITVSRDRLPIKEAVVLAAQDSSRIIFVIPRREMVIIGTTDTDYREDPSQVLASVDDIKYLLNITHNYFPSVKLKAGDIIASYAGVRPLVSDGSINESQTSRRHKIIQNNSKNVTFVMGGKYTTYRKIAEEVVETALGSFILEEKVRFCRSNTKQPLNSEVGGDRGGFMELEPVARNFHVQPLEVEKLLERHGKEAYRFLEQWAGVEEDMSSSLSIEVHHAVNNTMCLNLKDFYFRRMPLFLSREDHGWGDVESITNIFSDYFGWGEGERRDQVDCLKQQISRELEWKRQFME